MAEARESWPKPEGSTMGVTSWLNAMSDLAPLRYRCGHCGERISSATGFLSRTTGKIYICPDCDQPSSFGETGQYPGAPVGGDVPHLSDPVKAAYKEARDCMRVSACTAAAQMCRKILMNVAHDQGADEGLSFVQYVEYLATQGYIPPNARGWVDVIRAKGNEAAHEIRQTEKAEAGQLMDLTEMLLRIIYEFPKMVPAETGGPTT